MKATSSVLIGCACDRRHVEPTAVMLSSVERDGGLPDAEILVAAIGLEGEDHAVLRAGAGRLGHALRVIELTPESVPEALSARFTADRFPAMLARLFLPSQVGVRNARLITLDSDMIVSAELKPLVDLDLGGRICAAAPDPRRPDDVGAFDAGLTVVDVDEYNLRNVAVRCLRWMLERDSLSNRPDQDALNAVIGDRWRRLDGKWNVCVHEDPGSAGAGYEGAAAVHFAGRPKPWEGGEHAGAPLYARRLAELQDRLHRRVSGHVSTGRDFLATCYEVLLGRELETRVVIAEREAWPAVEIARSIVESPEFQDNVLRPLQRDEPFRPGLYPGGPTLRQRFWAADQLFVSAPSAAQLISASGWRDFLTVLLSDPGFSEAMALPFLPCVRDEDPAFDLY